MPLTVFSPIDKLCYSNHGDELHCDPNVALICNHEPYPCGQDLMEKSHDYTFCPILASTPYSRRTSIRSVDLVQPMLGSSVPIEDRLITASNVSCDSNGLLEKMTMLAKGTPSHLYGCGMFCKAREGSGTTATDESTMLLLVLSH